MGGSARAIDVIALAMTQCIDYLLAVTMITYVGIILIIIVVNDCAIRSDKRNPKVFHRMEFHIMVYSLLGTVAEIPKRLIHSVIIVLKSQIERINLVLPL